MQLVPCPNHQRQTIPIHLGHPRWRFRNVDEEMATVRSWRRCRFVLILTIFSEGQTARAKIRSQIFASSLRINRQKPTKNNSWIAIIIIASVLAGGLRLPGRSFGAPGCSGNFHAVDMP